MKILITGSNGFVGSSFVCNLKEMYDREKTKVFFAIVLLLILLATYKYVSKGDAYNYEIGWSGEKTEVSNNVIAQDIILDPKADWSYYSYEIYIYVENKIEQGLLEAKLIQEEKVIDSVQIKPVYLKTGWYVLDNLDYSKLNPGRATIQYSTVNTDYPIYLGTRQNIYNIPNCIINGQETSFVLAQRYHINYNNLEYKLRLLMYGFFTLLCITASYIVLTRDDNKKTANIIRIILIASLFCLTFIYDSSLIMSPTWAEEVTNFMEAGYTRTVQDNILLTDAGYLPLFQRLISLFCIKFLKLKAYASLYAMQLIAYLVTGIVLSFFVKYQFRYYFELKYRYLLSMVFMMLVIHKESGAFINFAGYGILIIFFYFLCDSKEWSRTEFVLLCVFSCLVTMSKGSYVTLLPFMILCMAMFFKNYSRRDFIFSIACAAGAFLQLIFYLRTDAGAWIDRNEYSGIDAYYLKLVIQSLIDVPNKLLGIFADHISIFDGISWFVIISFWTWAAVLFVREVLFKWISKDKINKNIQLIFMAIIYITAQSLFLGISIYGVSLQHIMHDNFWAFAYFEIASRHEVQIFIASAMFFAVLAKQFMKNNVKGCKEIAITALLVCVIMSQSRFQIKGVGNDDYVSARTNFAELDAEVELFKKYETNEVLAIPIQPNSWICVKNADLYCFGEDLNRWGARCVPTEEPQSGLFPLGNYKVDPVCEIYQIFIKKQNIINRSNYQVVLYDISGNEIYRQSQDNINYQLITSFTFDKPISHVGTAEILDSEGKQVFIENSIYVTTKAGSRFLME